MTNAEKSSYLLNEIIDAKRTGLRASESAAAAARCEYYADVRALKARVALIDLIGEDEHGPLDRHGKYAAVVRANLAAAEKRLAECDAERPVAVVAEPLRLVPTPFDAGAAIDAESVCEFGARAAGFVLSDEPAPLIDMSDPGDDEHRASIGN